MFNERNGFYDFHENQNLIKVIYNNQIVIQAFSSLISVLSEMLKQTVSQRNMYWYNWTRRGLPNTCTSHWLIAI